MHLYYGFRNSAEHAYKVVLEDVAAKLPQLQLHGVYRWALPEEEEGGNQQHQGRVDMVLLKHTLQHGEHQFSICGPMAMMVSLVPGLSVWVVISTDIHFEAFGRSSVRMPKVEATLTILW